RGELRKIVDAKSLLNRSHFVHHFLKTVIAKELVFLLLKILAERIKLMRRNDFAKRGKKNGVLTRFVRIIHADELPRGIDELRPLGFVLKRLQVCEPHRDVCDAPPSLMLLAQHSHQVHKFIGFFEARKKKILLKLLVIIFHETATDYCCVSERLRRNILLSYI